MNPWAFILGGLGIIIIMVGVKGSQHSIVAAIKGAAAPAAPGSAPAPKPQFTSPQGPPLPPVQGPPTHPGAPIPRQNGVK